ncbi:MAG: coproporphyrinogen III oxidase, partial [Hoeflea sp. BRH_c9]
MQRPTLPVGLPDDIEDKKTTAQQWFEQLRDQICASFEALEEEVDMPQASGEPGRFERTPWQRD